VNRSSLPRVGYSPAIALAMLACGGSAGCSDDVLQLGGAAQAAAAGSVDRLILRDAQSSAQIGDLTETTSISVATLESTNVNIEAIASGAVASVEFSVDGTTLVEHRVPFTYPGDTDGRLHSFVAEVGTHSVTATPYAALGALGERGTSLEVTLVFIE
jgi:hypothetical protein